MEATISKEDRFKTWLKDNGARFDKLDFRTDNEGCGGAYSIEDIQENEVFISIPFDPLVISATKARKALQGIFRKQSTPPSTGNIKSETNSDEQGQAQNRLDEVQEEKKRLKLDNTDGGLSTASATASSANDTPSHLLDKVELPDRVVLILYLMQQKLLGEEAFYSPYLDMVPELIPTSITMSTQDLEFLRGTNAFLVTQEMKEKLRNQYETTMQIVGHELSPNDYTWERYRWAETLISSRAFPAHLFGGAKEGQEVIIPGSDMMNHKCRQKATWIKTETGIDMSGSFTKAGDQVFNNYGPKSNEELIIGYGFSIENNPDDHVTLKANFSRDPDQDRKRAILERAGITMESVHYLGGHHVEGIIPTSLLITMRVMAMNPYEVEFFYAYSPMTERSIQEILASFVGFRNEFAMLDLLDMLLAGKLQALQESDRFIGEPENDAQRFAVIYRNGQRDILNKSIQQLKGMFAALLFDAQDKSIPLGNAPFLASDVCIRPLRTEQQLRELADDEKTKAATMTDLKQEAVRTLVVEARRLMIQYKEDVFCEALMSAFPNHGWGERETDGAGGPIDHSLHMSSEELMEAEDEMAIQLEQDAILTSFLIYLRHQRTQEGAEGEDTAEEAALNFVRAASHFDYASVLDEDMTDDTLDLQASLQEVFEAVDDQVFDPRKFSPEMFLWATGVLEVHSISFHLANGQVIGGIMYR